MRVDLLLLGPILTSSFVLPPVLHQSPHPRFIVCTYSMRLRHPPPISGVSACICRPRQPPVLDPSLPPLPLRTSLT